MKEVVSNTLSLGTDKTSLEALIHPLFGTLCSPDLPSHLRGGTEVEIAAGPEQKDLSHEASWWPGIWSIRSFHEMFLPCMAAWRDGMARRFDKTESDRDRNMNILSPVRRRRLKPCCVSVMCVCILQRTSEHGTRIWYNSI